MANSLTKILPLDIGIIHFIGIGGIGMSAIAQILHNLGYQIQGSDISQNYVVKQLEGMGIKVFVGHDKDNVEQASIVVKSTIIKDDNIEVMRAKELGVPIVKRSEMLAELMRFKHSISISGTHGKTTTTSLIAELFEVAGEDPTVINGGIINRKGSNAYLGKSDFLIAEADESDGTFIRVPSYIAVITNIDPEHLDYYGTFENAKKAFRAFIENLPFYGFGILCFDHPVVREIASTIMDRKIISYGISYQDADFVAHNIEINEEGSIFDVKLSERYIKQHELQYDSISGLELGIHGEHNISNALAAVAIGVQMNFDKDLIKRAFKDFKGVKRRFTKVGVVRDILIIDDYAHHPTEIKATLATAKQIAQRRAGKVIAVAQPHKYSRLRDLMEEFAASFGDADHVIISDVYPAGETSIEGISSEVLINKIKGSNVRKLDKVENLAVMINDVAKANDIVVLLGAGDITKWAQSLLHDL